MSYAVPEASRNMSEAGMPVAGIAMTTNVTMTTRVAMPTNIAMSMQVVGRVRKTRWTQRQHAGEQSNQCKSLHRSISIFEGAIAEKFDDR